MHNLRTPCFILDKQELQRSINGLWGQIEEEDKIRK